MQKLGSINTFWWSATCGWKMGKCSFHSLPFPSSGSHSHSRETSLAIPIPMGFPIPWDPWEFPCYAHL